MPVTTADRDDVAHHGLPVPEVVVLAGTDQVLVLSAASYVLVELDKWRRRRWTG